MSDYTMLQPKTGLPVPGSVVFAAPRGTAIVSEGTSVPPFGCVGVVGGTPNRVRSAAQAAVPRGRPRVGC